MHYFDAGPQAESFRNSFDPEHTLPVVSFAVVNTEIGDLLPVTKEKIEILTETGNQIGSCVLRTWAESRVNFADIRISKTGRGYGLASYLLAAEIASDSGMSFVTDTTYQSPSAKHIWEILEAAKIAEVVAPFKKFDVIDGEQKYRGLYRISPHA